MLRPRETKEYGPRADVQTPVLQYLVSVIVLCLSVLLVLSWIMFIPPIVPWLVGMAAALITPIVAWWGAMDWLLRWMGAHRDGMENAFVAHLLTTITVGVITALWCYNKVWDWWEGICYSGFFGVPTPHVDIGSPLLLVGLALFLLGGVFILWKPTGYTFTIQAIGAILGAVSWYFRAPSLLWTKGATTSLSKADLIFYGVWLAISISVWIPAWFLLDRMFTEMADDFPYEHADPEAPKTVTQTQYRLIPASPGRALSPPATPPAVISTFNGKADTLIRVDEFLEFIYLVQRKGTFAREKLFPYKFACSGRKVVQWQQWVELIFPLEPDVYNRATKEIQPEYQNEDGTLDAENVIAMLSLGGHDS